MSLMPTISKKAKLGVAIDIEQILCKTHSNSSGLKKKLREGSIASLLFSQCKYQCRH